MYSRRTAIVLSWSLCCFGVCYKSIICTEIYTPYIYGTPPWGRPASETEPLWENTRTLSSTLQSLLSVSHSRLDWVFCYYLPVFTCCTLIRSFLVTAGIALLYCVETKKDQFFVPTRWRASLLLYTTSEEGQGRQTPLYSRNDVATMM